MAVSGCHQLGAAFAAEHRQPVGHCRHQRCGRIRRGVVEVDFFDEPHGQLVVGKPHMFGSIDARTAVLAKPPEGERPEYRDRFIR